ncbi:MAG: Hsp20/alpha crystallin family protein [Thermodesulfobacteriota bacterium]
MIIRRISGWPSWELRSPFDELDRMRREMDRLSEAFTGPLFREPISGVFPLMNVTEDSDNYYVRAELPGIRAEDLNISIAGNSLTVSGERSIPAENEKARYHRREREAGKFSRVVSLPSAVDTAKVEAGCADGVLTVVLPKSEAAKPKQIAVKTS